MSNSRFRDRFRQGGGIPSVSSEGDLPNTGTAGQQYIVGDKYLYEWNQTISAWINLSEPSKTGNTVAQTKIDPNQYPSLSSSPETQIEATSPVAQTETAPTQHPTESTPLTDPTLESI